MPRRAAAAPRAKTPGNRHLRKRLVACLLKLALALYAIGGHDAENPLLPAADGRAGTYYRVNHRLELHKWSPYLAFCFFAFCAGRLADLPVAQYATERATASQQARVLLEKALAHDPVKKDLCAVYALKGA